MGWGILRRFGFIFTLLQCLEYQYGSMKALLIGIDWQIGLFVYLFQDFAVALHYSFFPSDLQSTAWSDYFPSKVCEYSITDHFLVPRVPFWLSCTFLKRPKTSEPALCILPRFIFPQTCRNSILRLKINSVFEGDSTLCLSFRLIFAPLSGYNDLWRIAWIKKESWVNELKTNPFWSLFSTTFQQSAPPHFAYSLANVSFLFRFYPQLSLYAWWSFAWEYHSSDYKLL